MNVVENYRKGASKILAVFTKTVKELEDLNRSIAKKKDSNETVVNNLKGTINCLKSENTLLCLEHSKNVDTINKLNSLFGK